MTPFTTVSLVIDLSIGGGQNQKLERGTHPARGAAAEPMSRGTDPVLPRRYGGQSRGRSGLAVFLAKSHAVVLC